MCNVYMYINEGVYTQALKKCFKKSLPRHEDMQKLNVKQFACSSYIHPYNVLMW